VALEAATRLMVLEVLRDAASEITREIAPGSVDVLLRGRDPQLVVTRPTAPKFAETTSAPADSSVADEAVSVEPLDDTVTSRTTLRLPDRLKAGVERAAAEEAVGELLACPGDRGCPGTKSRRAAKRETREGDSFTGWARKSIDIHGAVARRDGSTTPIGGQQCPVTKSPAR
jgi:hypothetical protein